MEQMQQLLPRTAQDHIFNSCRSDDIFGRLGVGQGTGVVMAVPLPVFFAQWRLIRRICGKQPDRSLAATYLMVPHEHKTP